MNKVLLAVIALAVFAATSTAVLTAPLIYSGETDGPFPVPDSQAQPTSQQGAEQEGPQAIEVDLVDVNQGTNPPRPEPQELVPEKEWSVKYIGVFRQAIKEEYGLDDETLNDNLVIISVSNDEEFEGRPTMRSERHGSIVYIYRIDWLPYNGAVIFDVKDKNGNRLSDQQISDNIKADTIHGLFTVESIITKEEALGLCDPPAAFPDFNSPWSNAIGDNAVHSGRANDKFSLFFECHREISIQENRCLEEVFSLVTGERLYGGEQACWVT